MGLCYQISFTLHVATVMQFLRACLAEENRALYLALCTTHFTCLVYSAGARRWAGNYSSGYYLFI